jgi:sugar (pentulose or hexulose) kinase
LAFALREGGERAAKRAKVPLRELRVSGGGAQSAAAVQLTADVFGLPTGRPHTHEATALGAAIDGAVGIGVHPNVEAAAREMTRVAEVRDPDPERQALYDELYQRVYLRMYERLKPLYEEIRDITGYPPR